MAGKVLLGLLAAAAVTGSAMLYSHNTGRCPLTGACTSGCSVEAVACDASADELPACCASMSKAKAVCCEGMDEGLASGGDAVAAVTGGVCLGR